MTTVAYSIKLPGAGTLITVHPEAVAVRLVMISKTPDRNSKHTTARIAKEVVKRVGGGKGHSYH